MADGGRGAAKIRFMPNRCKACEICIELCPHAVLERDEERKPVVKNPEKCTCCKLCEYRCPDFAIFVEDGDDAQQHA